MINIKLSPVFSNDESVSIEVYGDLIIINDEEFDFTDMPLGYHMNPEDIESPWFVDTVYKELNGDMRMTLRFPHPYDADESMRFPEPIIVTEDGIVNLPKYTPPKETLPEVIENEETGLLEIETDSNTDGSRDAGETTFSEELPSGD